MSNIFAGKIEQKTNNIVFSTILHNINFLFTEMLYKIAFVGFGNNQYLCDIARAARVITLIIWYDINIRQLKTVHFWPQYLEF